MAFTKLTNLLADKEVIMNSNSGNFPIQDFKKTALISSKALNAKLWILKF